MTLVGLGQPANAAEVLYIHSGNVPGAAFGTVAEAGDVDNDGFEDLLVGAPFDDTTGTAAGSVRVISGADGRTLFTFHGDGAGDLFGRSCSAAGDVDGDGHEDVAVGAPGAPATGSPGYVRLFSGQDGSVIRTITGTQAGGEFGFAVSGAGDLDGDDVDDLLVGAPRESDGGVQAGRAYAFSGADGSEIFAATGEGDGDGFGGSLDGGQPDVLNTDMDPQPIVDATFGGNQERGRIQVRSRTDFSVVHSFDGVHAWDHLGTKTRLAGDIDGDGIIDFILSTDPRTASGNPTRPGSAHVYAGDDGSLIFAFEGTDATSHYGAGVAGVGDVDGDGFNDLVVGEPEADVNGIDSGSIHVFSGADGSLLDTVHGPAPGAQFGRHLAYAGDLDGDGLSDVAVGAPGHDGTGSVFVLSLARWENLGQGVAGSSGVPELKGQGTMEPATTVTLTLENAAPATATTLVLGYSLHVDAELGVLAPTPDVVVDGLVTDAAGALSYDFPWPEGIPPDTTYYYQFQVQDPVAPAGLARSNTLGGTTP